MGKAYSYFVSFAAALGGLLFGYEIGIINQVLQMNSFQLYFGIATSNVPDENGVLPQSPNAADTEGWIVSSFLLGCIAGAIGMTFLADHLWRKHIIFFGSATFAVGGILQAAAVNLGMLYVGRATGGVAIGFLSGIVPMYIAECAPNDIRGRVTAIQQLMITIGIAVANIINAILASIINSFDNALWRSALAIQAIPGILLFIMLFWLPHSPRQLVSKGMIEPAEKIVAKTNGWPEGGEEAKNEVEEIRLGIEEEKAVGTATWGELLKTGILNRVLLGINLQMWQQWTGINAVMYYSSALFIGMGYSKQMATTVNTTLNSIVNVLATFPGMWLIERWGRKPLLFWGACANAFCMWMLVLWVALFEGTQTTSNGTVVTTNQTAATAYGALGAIFMYIFVVSFAASWGPVVWVYQSEIYPLRIRGKAAGLATLSNWIHNFIIAKVWPYAQKLGAWQYSIFGSTGIAMALYVYFFMPEVRGHTLEDMDGIFARGWLFPGFKNKVAARTRTGSIAPGEMDGYKAPEKAEVDAPVDPKPAPVAVAEN
ncbi:general substrate transporter [Hyaloraphidium curvatum]|nr:general substrate transporter [Hyaloraphidium curvatum]